MLASIEALLSWALRFRFRGKSKKLAIGPHPGIDLPTARKRAQEALGQIAAGMDPAEKKQVAKAAARDEKRARLDLVERVVGDFIERYAKPNTRDAAWSGRRLSQISRADVHDLLDRIVDRGAPVVANRTFAQFRKLCNWAGQRGLIEKSPCDGLSPPSTEKSRDRVLSADELALVWRGAEALGFPFGPIIKLLILTGQRRDEIGEGRWAEVDLEKRVWTIPAERSKNRRAHAVPLSGPAVEILASTSSRFQPARSNMSPRGA